MLRLFKRNERKALSQSRMDAEARQALMQAETAAQMIKLAGRTQDLAPLKQAEESLMMARNYYTFEDTPVEIGMVQAALGDMLFSLGRKTSDENAIIRAREAYRAAITLASLHGEGAQREDLRDKLRATERFMGLSKPPPPLFRVA